MKEVRMVNVDFSIAGAGKRLLPVFFDIKNNGKGALTVTYNPKNNSTITSLLSEKNQSEQELIKYLIRQACKGLSDSIWPS
jgi:hypothetical protein